MNDSWAAEPSSNKEKAKKCKPTCPFVNAEVVWHSLTYQASDLSE